MEILDGKVFLTSEKVISVDGGNVLHGIKNSDNLYKGFGEIYFSWIEKDFIKAWKRHKSMVMNLVVPYGDVKFVFFDDVNKKYLQRTIGNSNYKRLTVLPGVWFGFKGVSNPKSLVVNIANIPHDNNEVERMNKDNIKYAW